MTPERLFKSLADTTRLRAVMLIAAAGELCVCELTHALEASQPKVSRHLAQLRDAEVLQDRRDGLWIYYALHPELPQWAQEIIVKTRDAVRQQAPFTADRVRLSHMTERPRAARCARSDNADHPGAST